MCPFHVKVNQIKIHLNRFSFEININYLFIYNCKNIYSIMAFPCLCFGRSDIRRMSDLTSES